MNQAMINVPVYLAVYPPLNLFVKLATAFTVHVCVCVCMNVCMYVCMYICIQSYFFHSTAQLMIIWSINGLVTHKAYNLGPKLFHDQTSGSLTLYT